VRAWLPPLAAATSGRCTSTTVAVVVANTDPTGWMSVSRQHS